MFRRDCLLFLLALGLAGPPCAAAQQPAVETPPAYDADQRALDLESFDTIWRLVRERHWAPDLGGVDWDAAREKYRPQVEAADSRDKARGVMSDLLHELGQSHYGVIPASAYGVLEEDENGDAPEDGKKSEPSADAGLTVRLVDDAILVTQVRPDSAAAAAGVKPGWRLLEVRDKPAEKILAAAQDASTGPLRAETIIGLSLARAFRGDVNQKIPAAFMDLDDQRVDVELSLQPSRGKLARFGNLPPMRVFIEHRLLDNGIGYVHFNLFFDPVTVMTQYNLALKQYQDARGLIIDLRGNRGGIAGMTMGMARPFVTEKKFLGVMKMRGGELRFNVTPTAHPYSRPVVVLIDECSISSAEILAGGLKDMQAAQIIGRRSAGLALPSNVMRLPNGDGFQYALANYTSASGQVLEKAGVEPHQTMKLSRQVLGKQGDPFLAAASKWILDADGE